VTTKQWFYSEDEQQQGPVAEDLLLQRLESGSLSQETLVWTEGMTDWVPFGEVEVFSSVRPVVASDGGGASAEVEQDVGGFSPYAPPSVGTEVAVAPLVTSGPQVRPWIRLWARTIDVMIFGVLIGILLGMLAPEVLEIADSFFNVLILAVISLVEAASLALFGTTPGKAIFRVSVRHADGSRLSFMEAWVRALKVLFRGLGLGIPLISLITQIVACTRLNNNGITSWDQDANLTVAHQTIPAWRWLLIVIVIGGFVTLAAYGATA